MASKATKPPTPARVDGLGISSCLAADNPRHNPVASRIQAIVPCMLGVDPGISGAIAFYFKSNPAMVAAEDVPTVAGEIDAATLANRIRQMAPDLAVIERVGAMPGQGVSSTFRFGTAYGVVQGVIATLQIPVHFVSPGKWKKHFSLSAEKEEARKRALHRWPGRAELFARKRDHNRAEAALLALYGADVLLNEGRHDADRA